MVFVFPLAGLYSYGDILAVITVVAGIGIFTSGGIYKLNLLKWCGILWWAGGLALLFIDPGYRGLAMLPLIILDYLIPGIIFNIKYRKNGAKNVS